MNILYDKCLDGPLPQVDEDSLLAELCLRLPDLELLHTAEDPRPYEYDGLSAYRCAPLLVTLPERTEQVQGLLALYHRLEVPVTARSTGTGLSGGALPLENDVLLVMARSWRIFGINPLSRFIRVQPGVRNLTISQTTAPHGLYYAPNPSLQITCSIGGNVVENAGGMHRLKYGLTVHNLSQVDIATLEDERLSLGSSTLDSAGLDLPVLSTGSEGLLGVVAEVIVRLLPHPPVAKVLLASFDDVESTGRAVTDLTSAGIVPAGLEMMDSPLIHAAEDLIHAGYPVNAAAILLRELDGVEADAHEDCERVRELSEAAGSTSVRQAQDETERQRFWVRRKNTSPAVGWISPDYCCMDSSIPRRKLPRTLYGIAEPSREYGPRAASVFHVGNGNTCPLTLFDANLPGESERAEALGGRILELCVAVGGSTAGEYDVGREKINQMCAQLNANELTLLHAMKAALDPAGLLSPGKNVPTLHRCAEFGAMHVHHGRLPFPGLERF